jgi:NAD(P)H-hydrate repair Nnr-like enzyme with NAD(P)H-hydrate epimerase domain
MSTGAFSIDQLMELAGLSVSQAGMDAKNPVI